ncbi:ADP-ribosylglycohydrolase family protein [Phycicoccus flavus]|uniref:ADP-ribosylglycohydrolase n=1 Tax=Phycicoccus flavus TaxID=2502783 RepID=A0A8T6R311_9MICO|nr:ADP-ribosylglycohydrolase family protein [Phycicoccus flavus]NHA68768.1 hypothetical protein [Phycicoccus flavus]
MRSDRSLSATRASAAWAAWGDALGFITELTDAAGLRHRAGVDTVVEPIAWRRRIGGRTGVQAKLPAGSYSDDTQLRLATSRSIRGDGDFDVESFARVELVGWQAYHLGAGRGSKAAAAAMTRTDARWNQNTFATKEARYVDIGGNGAAMRIQPHVWAARNLDDTDSILTSVLKDAVCTHGHPVGLLGAAIHALSLAWTMREGHVPGPDAWPHLADQLAGLAKVITADEDLGGLWLPGWEQAAGRALLPALEECLRETTDLFRQLRSTMRARHASEQDAYRSAVESVGGFDPATRGSGTGTSILALYLAAKAEDPAAALQLAANTLGSDTDTIATMAGALIGVVVAAPPPTPVQDSRLIDREAGRMYGIATGEAMASFRYPDLLAWNPPRSALDLVGLTDGNRLALAGQGPITGQGEPVAGGRSAAPTLYQWASLPTGQVVFLRYRANPKPLPHHLLPPAEVWSAAPASPFQLRSSVSNKQPSLFTDAPEGNQRSRPSTRPAPAAPITPSIDAALHQAHAAGHTAEVVGQALLDVIAADPERSVERAAAFAAGVARDLNRPRV